MHIDVYLISTVRRRRSAYITDENEYRQSHREPSRAPSLQTFWAPCPEERELFTHKNRGPSQAPSGTSPKFQTWLTRPLGNPEKRK